MSTREKFEEWALTDAGNCNDLDLHKTDGEYDLPEVQRDFEVWQASRASALEEAVKECDEMAEAWNRTAQGASDGRYDFKCDAGDECADAIRALAKDGGE